MQLKKAAVAKAILPVIEGLEDRRLMSASLSLTNLDGLPSNNRLILGNTIHIRNHKIVVGR